jgi:hypothetical protein
MARQKIKTTELEAIAKALRDALMAYDELETQGTSRAAALRGRPQRNFDKLSATKRADDA